MVGVACHAMPYRELAGLGIEKKSSLVAGL